MKSNTNQQKKITNFFVRMVEGFSLEIPVSSEDELFNRMLAMVNNQTYLNSTKINYANGVPLPKSLTPGGGVAQNIPKKNSLLEKLESLKESIRNHKNEDPFA